MQQNRGTNGTTGANGTSGANGTNGANGTSSANNTTGTNGANGGSGTNGVGGVGGVGGIKKDIPEPTDPYQMVVNMETAVDATLQFVVRAITNTQPWGSDGFINSLDTSLEVWLD